jgi:hypothetical protein
MSLKNRQSRVTGNLTDAAMWQAAESRISMKLVVATAVAARVGARAEAQWYFTARRSRTTPARAMALLMRLGTPGEVREDDRLDASDEMA